MKDRPKFDPHCLWTQWHRFNVAELAKSFGRRGNSPKAYAASATKLIQQLDEVVGV